MLHAENPDVEFSWGEARDDPGLYHGPCAKKHTALGSEEVEQRKAFEADKQIPPGCSLFQELEANLLADFSSGITSESKDEANSCVLWWWALSWSLPGPTCRDIASDLWARLPRTGSQEDRLFGLPRVGTARGDPTWSAFCTCLWTLGERLTSDFKHAAAIPLHFSDIHSSKRKQALDGGDPG